MRKSAVLYVIITVIIVMAALAGCRDNALSNAINGGTAKKSIVCTTFPQYDWIREILKERQEDFELTLLLERGGDLHSYQPSAANIAMISSADMLVYVGGESDEWVGGVLRDALNEDMIKVNLMDALGAAIREEELAEGMESRGERNALSFGNEKEYDEHIWLSLKNAAVLTETLLEGIKRLDGTNSSYYESNAKAYIEELRELDRLYEGAVKDADVKTLLFGDRFPFRYMAEDYALGYYAAFPGCSAETDASFDTITFLAEKADGLDIHAILVIEGSSLRLAGMIRDNTRGKNQEILAINSLQSVALKDIENGFTYINAMRDNLEVLKKAMKRQ